MAAIWAIADLHLSFGVPNKSMEVFGLQWKGYTEKIKKHWLEQIQSDDLVLIAGDISWGMRLEEARPDLEWIHHLPGTKVLIRGNHDYWWGSLSQIAKICPPSIHLIQNNAFQWKDVSIAGSRLWDSPDFNFKDYINLNPTTKAPSLTEHSNLLEDRKIWNRELARLELSLKCLNKNAQVRIAMTHYPPVGADLQPSPAAILLQQYHVNLCVFGHLHNVKRERAIFGEKEGIRYLLTACDYLDFNPIKIKPLA